MTEKETVNERIEKNWIALKPRSMALAILTEDCSSNLQHWTAKCRRCLPKSKVWKRR